jgi:hypothetical protein
MAVRNSDVSGGTDTLRRPVPSAFLRADSVVAVLRAGHAREYAPVIAALAGWRAGATAVKIFPASTVGAGYIAQLQGPFPDLQVIPSGGIAIEDAPAWISAGAVAVSMGGPLIGDAFKGGDLEELTRRAEKVSRLVAEAISTRSAG